jgi:hypothetical protein
LTLNIYDCVLLALKNNSEIKIASVNPKIRADDVRIAWAEFEPTLNLDYMLTDTTERAASSLLGAGVSTSREMDANLNISEK